MTALNVADAVASLDVPSLAAGAVSTIDVGPVVMTARETPGTYDAAVRTTFNGFPALEVPSGVSSWYEADHVGWSPPTTRTYGLVAGGLNASVGHGASMLDNTAQVYMGVEAYTTEDSFIGAVGLGVRFVGRTVQALTWPRVVVLSVDDSGVDPRILAWANEFEPGGSAGIAPAPSPDDYLYISADASLAIFGWWMWDQAVDEASAFDTARALAKMFGATFGAGMHSVRQRQNAAGNAGGHPTRQRGLAGQTGSWPLRHR